jgi:hypothetical protein
MKPDDHDADCEADDCGHFMEPVEDATLEVE